MSFSVSQGEVVGLLGPNGAGKTTSFYMMVGLIKPTSGDVHMGGDPLSKLPMHIRAKKGIGYLPQEASIFRKLSVRENIEAVLEFQKLARSEIRKKQTTYWMNWSSAIYRNKRATAFREVSAEEPKSPGHWPQTPGSFYWMSRLRVLTPLLSRTSRASFKI